MKKFEILLQKLKWIDLIAPSREELNLLSSELNIPSRILINALDPEHLPKYELFDSTAVIYLRTIDISKPVAINILDLTTKITLIIKKIITSTLIIKTTEQKLFFFRPLYFQSFSVWKNYKNLKKLKSYLANS